MGPWSILGKNSMLIDGCIHFSFYLYTHQPIELIIWCAMYGTMCTHTKYSTKSIDSVMPIDLFCYSHLFTVTLNTTCHVKFIYWWKTLNAGHHLANVFQHVVRMNGFSRMFLFFFNFCTAQNNERNVWGAKVKWFYVWVFYIIQTYISTTFPNKSTW